ncbi:Uncharacterized protein DAT39_004270 [Clarias magur]|uniref:Uncharacterized protein n=1 Tax=Clarias magur TaxID=1594786 RepID=A0A8J4XFW0_CLAMG|nr:Uncharacterized protein DAT39_004270 [Clarias magur]
MATEPRVERAWSEMMEVETEMPHSLHSTAAALSSEAHPLNSPFHTLISKSQHSGSGEIEHDSWKDKELGSQERSDYTAEESNALVMLFEEKNPDKGM